MIILIDNYDSFTFNIVRYLRELGADVAVYENDEISPKEIAGKKPKGIVLSPGPKTPNEAGICLEVVDKFAGKLPILGICLGHQVIGQAFGGKVIRAPKLMHGRTSQVTHTGKGLFKDIPSPLRATRYHSLTLEPENFPKALDVTAIADGVIMGLAHKEFPVWGVQFHPESILSEHGHKLLQNFLDEAQ